MREQTASTACTRRSLLRSGAGGAIALTAASATPAVAAQESPYDGYLSDVGNYDGTTVDLTGQSEVTVEVGAQGNGGGFAFAPPAINVDPGTTVVWEWTGEGGQHNVINEGGAFESELVGEGGHTFQYTFEESGVFKYFCQPHKGLGMKGVVAVGDTAEGQVGSPGGDGAGGGNGGDGGGGGQPDFEGYLDDVGNYDGSVSDARGESEVTVEVGAQGNGGGFAFAPPAVHVDTGATVVWEWTGEGGQHNVVNEGGAFESELVGEAGHTFQYTFEESGIYRYFCQPHKSLGMKGAVVVGDDYPTTDGGEAGEGGDGGDGGDGGEGAGGGGDGGDAGPETAANQLAAQTLLAMLALAFLSPIVFLLVARRRMSGPPRQN